MRGRRAGCVVARLWLWQAKIRTPCAHVPDPRVGHDRKRVWLHPRDELVEVAFELIAATGAQVRDTVVNAEIGIVV